MKFHGNSKETKAMQLKDVKENVFSEDLESVQVLDKFPELRRLKPRDQLIMTSLALGHSVRYTAEAMGVSKSLVSKVSIRVDPSKRFLLDEDARKAFIGQSARTVAMEAISAVTPEKLNDCSAPAAAKVAKTMMETAAIADRKELNLGDGKVKKVVIEFHDPVMDVKEAEEAEEITDAELVEDIKEIARSA